MNPWNPIPARNAQPEERGNHFAVPLGSSRSGRLRFMNGAHQIVIRSDPRERSLCRAGFGSRTPTVGVQGSVVTVRYPRSPTDEWLDCEPERPAEVALNAGIPWDIEVRGGSSRLLADLRDLRLGSFRLDGGAGRLELALPAPRSNVDVVLHDGVSNVAISRPAGVPARLRVEGGVTNLTFDERRIGAAGSDVDLRSRGYDRVVGRYDVTVTGGANNVSLCEQKDEGLRDFDVRDKRAAEQILDTKVKGGPS